MQKGNRFIILLVIGNGKHQFDNEGVRLASISDVKIFQVSKFYHSVLSMNIIIVINMIPRSPLTAKSQLYITLHLSHGHYDKTEYVTITTFKKLSSFVSLLQNI